MSSDDISDDILAHCESYRRMFSSYGPRDSKLAIPSVVLPEGGTKIKIRMCSQEEIDKMPEKERNSFISLETFNKVSMPYNQEI
jgi:hypothetical protein